MAGVEHALMFGALSAAVGIPLLFVRRSGLFGSREKFIKVRADLLRDGRVVLQPSIMGRTLGMGALTISDDGLSIQRGKWTAVFAWKNISTPFALEEHLRASKITFKHEQANPRFGKRGLFKKAASKSEFVETRQAITSAYGLGWGDLAKLLNISRDLFRERASDPFPLRRFQLTSRR